MHLKLNPFHSPIYKSFVGKFSRTSTPGAGPSNQAGSEGPSRPPSPSRDYDPADPKFTKTAGIYGTLLKEAGPERRWLDEVPTGPARQRQMTPEEHKVFDIMESQHDHKRGTTFNSYPYELGQTFSRIGHEVVQNGAIRTGTSDAVEAWSGMFTPDTKWRAHTHPPGQGNDSNMPSLEDHATAYRDHTNKYNPPGMQLESHLLLVPPRNAGEQPRYFSYTGVPNPQNYEIEFDELIRTQPRPPQRPDGQPHDRLPLTLPPNPGAGSASGSGPAT